MARFPSVPGAGAKRISNPVYWARMELQNTRYKRQSYSGIQRFNERWERLGKIQNIVSDDYIDTLQPVINSITEKEWERLTNYIDDMKDWELAISNDIEIASYSHLSKLATRLKKVALTAIKLCKKYKVYGDIHTVSYDAKEKMIILNGQDFFFFG